MRDRFGETPPITRAADVAASLQQFYEDRGYLGATVTVAPPVIEHDPDRATLVFDVASGPRTTIARSTVTGRPLAAAPEIQSRLEIQPGAVRTSPAELRERLDDLRRLDAQAPVLPGVGRPSSRPRSTRTARRSS